MRNICFQTNRNNRIRQKVVHVLRKIQTLRVNNSINLRTQNTKFSGYYFYMKTSIWRDFQIYISVPLSSNPANISCFPRRLQRNTLRLPRRLEDIFQDVFKASSRHLQDVFARRLAIMSSRRFEETSRRLGRQKNVTLKTSSRRLQDVFSTSWPRGMFDGKSLYICQNLKVNVSKSVNAVHTENNSNGGPQNEKWKPLVS